MSTLRQTTKVDLQRARGVLSGAATDEPQAIEVGRVVCRQMGEGSRRVAVDQEQRAAVMKAGRGCWPLLQIASGSCVHGLWSSMRARSSVLIMW